MKVRALNKFIVGRKEHGWNELGSVNYELEIEQELMDLLVYWIMMKRDRVGKEIVGMVSSKILQMAMPPLKSKPFKKLKQTKLDDFLL